MALKKVAIIPARSGSKGLPNKNILMLLDKPLLAYTIEAAIESKEFSRVIVSTDSAEYKDISMQYGAEVIIRDEALASDTSTTFMVIKDVLEKTTGFDYFVLLQPTSPFRSSVHIQEAVSLFENSSYADYLVSVVETDKCADLIKPLDGDNSLRYFDADFSNYRRQNKKNYSPNGAIFIAKIEPYLKQKHFFGEASIAYKMNKADSLDIDDRLDFEFAITIMNQKNKKNDLHRRILQRIEDKSAIFNQKTPVTLIGHSIFDFWDVEFLNGQKVNNLGIAGINSEQYYNYILKKNYIKSLGESVILLLGTNDIVLNEWSNAYTIYWVDEIVCKIKDINPEVCIYLLSVPPVLGRIDRSNKTIQDLNLALEEHYSSIKGVTWIPLSQNFYDQYGNLNKYYTYDGLHFNKTAYIQLQKELEEKLK